MALAAVRRRYSELHEARPFHNGTFEVWNKDPTPGTPFHFMDGVTLWVSREDLSPDDDFLGDQEREALLAEAIAAQT